MSICRSAVSLLTVLFISHAHLFAQSCPAPSVIAQGGRLSCGPDIVQLQGTAIDTSSKGLAYQYYHGSWDQLPDFDTLTAITSGLADNFDIGLRSQNDNFAFRFRGFILIPTGGTYTFYTSSDDGSKLFINGAMVVDNDGLHSNQERSGQINLTAGFHPIEGQFFEKGGNQVMEVRFQGPGISKQLIPDEVLFHQNADHFLYTWTGPNGFYSTDPSPSTTAPGIYLLFVDDTLNNCFNSDTALVRQDANVASGGLISGDEVQCDPFTASPIQSIELASGGQGGSIVYRWQQRKPGMAWDIVPGVGSPILFPGTIVDTLEFVREASRVGCSDWVPSNIITKRIKSRPDIQITVSDTSSCPGDSLVFSVADIGGGATYNWQFGSGSFPNQANGPGPHHIQFDEIGQIAGMLITHYDGCNRLSPFNSSIYARPEVIATGGELLCDGTPLELDGQVLDLSSAGLDYDYFHGS
ncbi:MAG: PA14 domain-containing protein, partial [Bacteroidota bacterium]